VKMLALVVLLVVSLALAASAEIYFGETFSSGKFGWTKSAHKGDDNGLIEVSHGEFFNDEKEDVGAQTKQDARFYQYSKDFPKFSNKGKTLVFQFSAKHEQNIDCGGGYIKLLSPGYDAKDFNGDTPYNVMFGPDICGPGTRRVHVILNYKGTNHLIKKEISCPADEFTHVYTLIINPDQTFSVLVDGKEERNGNLVDEFDFLPPKEIKDPAISKPADWVDEKEIDDPTDVKPKGWDDIPQYIADPDAEKPEEWDEELDGEYEAPLIENPDYQGEWSPRQIPNPAYKGVWVHPLIPNPEYKDDHELYAFEHAGVGLEIWQVKSGTIFDNVLVTDSVATAQEWRERSLASQKAEKSKKEAEDERKRAAAAEAEPEEDDFEADEHEHDEL